ncbi:MAG: helix-turn-helix domain-containing protein [Clostridia bacterium]|nr:helix-turn-helix domain-containing protein [Clostridia bacterium]
MLHGTYTAFRIIDVLSSERRASEGSFEARPWAALAYREVGDSVFTVGGRELIAGSGTVLYIPAGVAFSRRSTEERLVILHLEVYGGGTEPAVLVCPDSASAREQLCAILSIWEEKAEGYEHRAAAMLHHFLAGLAGAHRQSLPRRAEVLIGRGVEYLSLHYREPGISVREIAAHCSVSEEYFRRLYKAAFGISPHRAIVEKRLDHACLLLRTTDLPVVEVALESGFSDVKYFSTFFHKEMKLSPSAYRRAYEADA